MLEGGRARIRVQGRTVPYQNEGALRFVRHPLNWMPRTGSSNGIRFSMVDSLLRNLSQGWVQSGEKNVGILVLMSKKRRRIGLESHFCRLGIESEL